MFVYACMYVYSICIMKYGPLDVDSLKTGYLDTFFYVHVLFHPWSQDASHCPLCIFSGFHSSSADTECPCKVDVIKEKGSNARVSWSQWITVLQWLRVQGSSTGTRGTQEEKKSVVVRDAKEHAQQGSNPGRKRLGQTCLILAVIGDIPNPCYERRPLCKEIMPLNTVNLLPMPEYRDATFQGSIGGSSLYIRIASPSFSSCEFFLGCFQRPWCKMQLAVPVHRLCDATGLLQHLRARHHRQAPVPCFGRSAPASIREFLHLLKSFLLFISPGSLHLLLQEPVEGARTVDKSGKNLPQ